MDLIDGKYKDFPKIAKQKGYILTRLHDFEDGWFIYKREKENSKWAQYELVYLKKIDGYKIGGSYIEPYISYPSDAQFGFTGFSCISLERAKEKHDEVIKRKEHRKNR